MSRRAEQASATCSTGYGVAQPPVESRTSPSAAAPSSNRNGSAGSCPAWPNPWSGQGVSGCRVASSATSCRARRGVAAVPRYRKAQRSDLALHGSLGVCPLRPFGEPRPAGSTSEPDARSAQRPGPRLSTGLIISEEASPGPRDTALLAKTHIRDDKGDPYARALRESTRALTRLSNRCLLLDASMRAIAPAKTRKGGDLLLAFALGPTCSS